MTGLLARLLAAVASLWLTLVLLLLAMLLLLVTQFTDWPLAAFTALPFAGLCLNLLGAIAMTRKLRRQVGLLGFHLALAILALLVAGDRLMSLTGHVEVTEGAAFDARLVEAQEGPLHPWSLDRIRFLQGDFSIDYGPKMKRRHTRSKVFLPDGEGGYQALLVGDDDPLVFGDYRFYTSFNKGFAPVLRYRDAAGRVTTGAVHLPSYPLNYFKQGNDWRLPDNSETLKLWLHLPEPVYDEEGAWHFAKPRDAVLVVLRGDERREMRPGDRLALGGGELGYESLASWMGYTISFNPLRRWMLAAIAVAILCLAWHAGRKMVLVPWQSAGQEADDRGE